MKMRVWSATCAAVVFAVTAAVLAQDPPSSQASQSKSTAAKKITVTGCVQRAQQSAPSTPGTGATSSATETKFVLTNASINTTGTAATSGATNPPSTAVASEYRLDAADAKLTSHVGHKVEITGTVEQPTGTTAQPPAASAANAPTLKVDDVKMLGSTCP
jgi:hypothetical protein